MTPSDYAANAHITLDRSSGNAGGLLGRNGSATASSSQPTVDAALQALTAARTLAENVSAAVDRFCGTVPQLADGPASNTGSSGAFPELREASRRTMADISAAQTQLNRLLAEIA